MTLIIVVVIAILALVLVTRPVTEQFRTSVRNPLKYGGFRNPVKFSTGGYSGTKAAPSNAIVPANGKTAGTAKGTSGGTAPGVSKWQKADSIFGGLNLATLPLFFIPFGGGGGGGEEDGAMYSQYGDTSSLASSSSSSLSSLIMAGLLVMLAVASNR